MSEITDNVKLYTCFPICMCIYVYVCAKNYILYMQEIMYIIYIHPTINLNSYIYILYSIIKLIFGTVRDKQK